MQRSRRNLQENGDVERAVDAADLGSGMMHAFLLPAILGDEPQLISFRQALRDQIIFELVPLPDLAASTQLVSSMKQTGEAVAKWMVGRQPSGSLAIFGFSFGASLALEVATQLMRLGRTVSFLGVLDGAFSTYELRRSKSELLRLLLSARGAADLFRHGYKRVSNRVRLIVANRRSIKPKTPEFEEALLIDLRCKALNSWQPARCYASGIIVFSGTLGQSNRERWLDLCPGLEVVDVPSKHNNFLTGKTLEVIVQAVAARAVNPNSGTERVPS